MNIDLTKIAETLIIELWAKAEQYKERAEGVKLFLRAVVQEGEKKEAESGQDKDSIPDGTTKKQE